MQDHNSPDNYPTDDNDNDNNDNNNDSHNLAWGQYFIFRNQFDAGKSLVSDVRPVRAF